MSCSRERAHEPQSILGFEFCKIPYARRYCNVRSLCLRITRVLVGFGPCNILSRYVCMNKTWEIFVTTKNTCHFTLHRVWNIDVHNAENSISGPLAFKIFWGGGGVRGPAPRPHFPGAGNSHMKQTGMLVVSLRSGNFGFWSRLGCSRQSANILCHQGLFLGSAGKHRITRRETEVKCSFKFSF